MTLFVLELLEGDCLAVTMDRRPNTARAFPLRFLSLQILTLAL